MTEVDKKAPNGCRIVLVMPRAPLPFGNADARWYYVLLCGLVERGYRVTAFAACADNIELEAARAMFRPPKYDLRLFNFSSKHGWWSKFQSWRRPHSYMFSEAFVRELKEVLAQGFEILHLEQLCSGWVGLEHAPRALLNIHNLTSLDLKKTASSDAPNRFERHLALKAERRLIPRFAYLRTLSPQLQRAVRQLNPDATITALPIGIDLSLYRFIPDHERAIAPVVSLIGSMNWLPTASAARRLASRLWPKIKEQVPEATLKLVGWEARDALKAFLSMNDVFIEENVASTQPYFSEAGVLVYAPEHGTGMKIKILEALAYGVPIVTNSAGIEGFPDSARDAIEVADDDEGLVSATVRLLRDARLRNQKRALGRHLVEETCGSKPTLDGLEAIYRNILTQQSISGS